LPSQNSLSVRPSLQFWLLFALLALVFLTGGASRNDVQSLVILRPASVLFAAAALTTLRADHFSGRAVLSGLFAAAFALALLHVIPLPPAIWQNLPGRELSVEIEALVGLENIWRPLSLTPMNGWHAVFALFTPLAVLLLGVQLRREELFRLLPVIIGFGALSGLFGLLQAIGDPQGPLYLYRITNNGYAVGLFSNRNHAATLLGCMFPMLALFASTGRGTPDEQNRRILIAAAIGIVLIPLILVTGSRAGLVIGVLGLLGAALLYRKPVADRPARRGDGKWNLPVLPALGAVGLLSLVFLAMFFSRAEAIERMFGESVTEDSRGDYWSIALDLVWQYFPAGSGNGSFVEVFQTVEPSAQLGATYLNRAHNDWLEIALTLGLPGMALLAAGVVAIGLCAFRLWRNIDGGRRTVAFGKAATILLALVGVASVSDYPLRTPIMMSLLMIWSLWLFEAGRAAKPSGPALVQGETH
jgi:O-antigen ligase